MTDTKISTKEAIMIVITVFVSRTIVALPRNLLKVTKSATILNLLFIGIIAILLSYLIYRLLKNFASCDIVDISGYLGGRVFKNIIGAIFIAYFVLSSASLLRNFCEGLKTVYFPHTEIKYILLAFTIAICISNSLKFSSNSKTIAIVLPIVIISILFLFFANFKNFAFEKMFPVLGEGAFNTFVTGFGNLAAFGGITCLYFLPPFLKDPSKMKTISIVSIGIAVIYLILCVATILFMFSFFIDVDEVLPLYVAARYIEFGSFFQRLESIFLLIWMLEICCYLSIANRFAMNCFKKISKIQSSQILAFVFPILIFAISLIPANYAVSRFIKDEIYKYLVLIIVFVLGISVLILANIKKKIGVENE